MSKDLIMDGGWVPDACTLPTTEQPVRREEFDHLFAADVIRIDHVSAQRVRLELRADPAAAGRAASLAASETGCCSFFTFQLTLTAGEVSMTVSTEPGHEPVLAALAARAQAKLGVGA
jgi:hypothetical protein